MNYAAIPRELSESEFFGHATGSFTGALRQRGSDIALLAEQFLRDAVRRIGHRPPRITKAVARQLESYPWPGNVREPQHVLERAALMSPSRVLELEIDNLRAALEQACGKVYGAGGAAELLGMKPTTLASRLEALKIKPLR